MESGIQKCHLAAIAVLLGLLCSHFVCVNAETSEITEALRNVCSAQDVRGSFSTFPVENLLPRNRFVIFLDSNNQSYKRILTRNAKCIDGFDSNSVQLAFCNINKPSQKWIRFGNQLVNFENGMCLTTQTGCFQTLEICGNQSTSQNQEWSCSYNNTSLAIHGSSTLTSLETLFNNHQLCLNNQKSTRWNFADDSGKIMRLSNSLASQNIQKMCKKSSPYCGPPIQGVSSFVLTTKDILNNFRFRADLLYQIIHSPYKTCFVGGEEILIGCAVGHEDIRNNGNDYKQVTCLGGGVWSDPSSLNCKKKVCPAPEPYPTAYRTGKSYLFGDMVTYHCKVGYTGKKTTKICGPRSQWEGEFPKCISQRDNYLNASSGTIKSPNYPNPYPNNLKFKWTINVKEGLRVVLWVRDFFIQPGSLLSRTCQSDIFYIEDCLANNMSTLYCGSSVPDFWISTGNVIIIGLITDNVYQAKGFKIDYTTWNSSESAEPMEPLRNGSFSDEEDKTHVFTGNEYAVYWVEAIYCTLAVAAIIFVIVIVFSTLFSDIRSRIHPVTSSLPGDEDFVDEERKRKLAQRRMTTVFDPATLRQSILVPDELIDGWDDVISNCSSDDSYIELPGYTVNSGFHLQQETNKSNSNSDSSALPAGGIRPLNSVMKPNTSKDNKLTMQVPTVNVIQSSMEEIPNESNNVENQKNTQNSSNIPDTSITTTPEKKNQKPAKAKKTRGVTFNEDLPV